MSKRHTTPPFRTITLALLVALGLAGCSKKADHAAVSPPSVNTDQPAVASGATPAATVVPSIDIKKSFAAVDSAMKTKSYVIAVQDILAVQQQKQLTDQEAQEAHNRMLGLQSSLATSIANGDANALAAAQLLRQSVLR